MVRACVGAAVSASEFPSSEFVRRRVDQFQKCFVSHATRLFAAVPLDVRLSSLALAVTAVTHDSRHARVTLADFLRASTADEQQRLPCDLLERCAAGQTDYVPCVPDALFPGITHARRDNVRLLTHLGRACVRACAWHDPISCYSSGSDSSHRRASRVTPPAMCCWLRPAVAKTGRVHCPGDDGYTSPVECPLPLGIRPCLTRGSTRICPQTAFRSVYPFCSSQTERHTDHGTE